jgi:hypothetical protein
MLRGVEVEGEHDFVMVPFREGRAPLDETNPIEARKPDDRTPTAGGISADPNPEIAAV